MSKIIINADDFGLDEKVSDAITKAFANGYITDTTMMATTDFFDKAVDIAKENGFFDKLGLHLDFFSGGPLSEEFKNCNRFCDKGKFANVLSVKKFLSKSEKKAFYSETKAQILKLKSAGIEITHADSHHHIHNNIFIAGSILRALKEENVRKIRITRNYGDISFFKKTAKNLYNLYLKLNGFKTTDYFCYPHEINDSLPDNTEIMVHPDYDKNENLINAEEWFVDKEPIGPKLSDVVKRVNGMQKISYKDL